MFNQSWKDQQEIEEISPARYLLGAAGIVCLVLVGIVFIVVGLSL